MTSSKVPVLASLGLVGWFRAGLNSSQTCEQSQHNTTIRNSMGYSRYCQSSGLLASSGRGNVSVDPMKLRSLTILETRSPIGPGKGDPAQPTNSKPLSRSAPFGSCNSCYRMAGTTIIARKSYCWATSFNSTAPGALCGGPRASVRLLRMA